MFREAMPKPLRIQSPREIGQNCQLLLPISFKFPAGYIDDYLFYYSVRKGSHSRVEHSFEEKMKIIEIADIVLKNIANSLSADNYVRENVMRVIRAKTARSKLRALLIYNRKDNVDAYAFSLKELGCYNKNDAVLVLKIKYPLVRCLISLYDKINRRLKFLS